jgi:plasmid stabilization system protein ParE
MRAIHVDMPVQDELAEIVAHYELARPGLGEQFMLEFRELIWRIAENPRLYVKYYSGRKVTMDRFRYLVLYRFDRDNIYVLAVMHAHTNPRTVKRRMRH